MATKYLENFHVTHFTSDKYDSIYANYIKLSEIAEKEGSYQSSQTKNKLKLLEIQANLAKANSLFYKKKFREALETYQLIQGMLFQLLYPSFRPDYYAGSKHNIPITASMFEPFLKTGLDIVGSFQPREIASNVALASFKDVPKEVSKFGQQFDAEGVNAMSDAVPDDVRNYAMLGLEYAKSYEWKKAEAIFKQGLESLAGAATPDAQLAKASLELNLAAVYIQKNELPLARKFAAVASDDFQRSNDKLGEAQAKINMAAVFNKEGKLAEAEAIAKEAEALLQAEEKNGSSAPTRPTGSTGISGGDISLSAGATSLTRFPFLGSEQPSILIRQPFSLSSAGAKLGTTITSDSIFNLASKKGNGVVFRLPNKGDGWITQNLEGNIEKKQKGAAKEWGIKQGDKLINFKWTEAAGFDANDVKSSYYETRINNNILDIVNNGYRIPEQIAINLPHLYLYQVPVCIGDCYHHLGEYNKALTQYVHASTYQYINTSIELPSLWIKIARNYLVWGNSLYKENEVQQAFDTYSKVIKIDNTIPATETLYVNKLKLYGDIVAANIATPDPAKLNPDTINVLLDIRNRLKMIEAGLDFFGLPANYFPIFKFDYLQSVATYFSQQAIQAERDYINFTSHGEDEELTREQLEQSVEMGKAQVELTKKQVEYAEAELKVNEENKQLADLRHSNAQQQKQDYADVSYEIAALEAATVFASGPEGYEVSYTYYSPSEGKNVTLSGSDAYKVMEDAAWKKGMLSREMELANMDRNIAELNENKQLAAAQVQAAQVSLEVAQQQQAIAEMNQKHSEELLDSFESQIFTPEVWFQLGARMLYISKTYLQRAIGVAKKMQKAYELETGRALNTIKNDYTTNIISGLLSADYLLSDINYFTIDRINNSKSKDIPIKQVFSISSLNPIGFQTTFKQTGRLNFETTLSDFDLAYPGAYLRKIKKIELVIEGLLPPGGVHGTLKNSGISRDRKINGDIFYRIQPYETMYLSNYNPRQDVLIFQPDTRVLDVYENCGVATGWTIDIPPAANDLNYQTISDIKMVIYYTAQYDALLENKIKTSLPKTSERNTAIPFRLLFPDEYFNFIDSGELKFSLYESDFAYNETKLKVKNIGIQVVMQEGTSVENRVFNLIQGPDSAKATTDAKGIVKSDSADNANKFNVFIDKDVCTEWTIRLDETDNAGIDRTKIKDLFFFVEYSFTYKGM